MFPNGAMNERAYKALKQSDPTDHSSYSTWLADWSPDHAQEVGHVTSLISWLCYRPYTLASTIHSKCDLTIQQQWDCLRTIDRELREDVRHSCPAKSTRAEPVGIVGISEYAEGSVDFHFAVRTPDRIRRTSEGTAVSVRVEKVLYALLKENGGQGTRYLPEASTIHVQPFVNPTWLENILNRTSRDTPWYINGLPTPPIDASAHGETGWTARLAPLSWLGFSGFTKGTANQWPVSLRNRCV